MSAGLDPREMTEAERLAEIGRILATAYLRLVKKRAPRPPPIGTTTAAEASRIAAAECVPASNPKSKRRSST